jgi:predicted DNA-binding protein (MmcQ/YjbR family)
MRCSSPSASASRGPCGLCLSFPGSEETFPFGPGTPVYKVAGKVFALCLSAGEPSVNLKCEPGLAEQLRASHPEVTPGYHMNKRHWNTVSLHDLLRDEMIADLVEDFYDLVLESLPRTRQQALRWLPRRDRS